jgi:hypothetical protein
MITLDCSLINVVRDGRLAYFHVDGRGVLKVPLSTEQLRQLAGQDGKSFVVTIAEVGTLIPLETEDSP